MKKLLSVFKDAALRLYENNPMRLSGATAFFSTFAIPPIVILISNALRTLANPDYPNKLFNKLESIVGPDAVGSLRSFQQTVSVEEKGILYTTGSIIFFVFVATNLFRVVQQSLNELYQVEEKKTGFVTGLIERAMGFAFILFSGLLFLATLFVDAGFTVIENYLNTQTPIPGEALIRAGNMLAYFLFVFVWFAVIIEFLPALRIHWKAIGAGSLVTSTLFVAGKFVLNWTVFNGRIKTVYETSTSAVLLLIFIFFVSLIIYYGACFTISFAQQYDLPVKLKGFAVRRQRN